MLQLKQEYGSYAINIDTPYLNHPRFLSLDIATEDFLSYIDSQILFMEENKEFSDYEIKKLTRVKSIFISSLKNTNKLFQQDFVKFVDEYDRRRNTNFLETFPEMEKFYKDIKEDF